MEKKKRNGKWIWVLVAAVLVAAAVLAFFLLRPANITEELVVEAGRESVSANEFRREDEGVDAQFASDLTGLNLNTPGTYPVQIQYKHKTYDCNIIVRDTTAPQAQIRDVAIYSNQTLKPEDFVTEITDVTAVTVSWESEPDLSKDAVTQMTILLTDAAGNVSAYGAMLTVMVDNGPPQLSGVKDIYTYLGTEPDYLAGITAKDDREGALEILVDHSQVDLTALGTYEITYSVTDAAGYSTTATAAVTVTDDNTPPAIRGIHDISLYLGSTVSYRSGVLVSDDQDPAPKLEVDSSQVDLSKAGTYPLVYIARDLTGNETRVEVTVTVAEKPATYVEAEVIHARADELLKKIVKEDMTTEAKVKAIYNHLRWNYGYTSHSDKTDWLQGAWVMMDEGRGDCFNYFALTKLLLDRCGIPNIDVRKVRNSERDSDHYWSLVSVDGGSTYYHLDTTPRMGDGDNFFLVTDAYLDAYSNANYGSHNRDKSLYPATPEA